MDNNVRFEQQTAEQWRRVVGASRYEISSAGRLRSLVTVDRETGEPYMMRWSLSDGYCTSGIKFDDGVKRTVHAHRLVGEAFLGPRPSPQHMVLHRNDVRTENTVENLRWGTAVDNANDATRNGSRLPVDPESKPGRLGAATVRAIRNHAKDGKTVCEIAKLLGLDYGDAYRVVTGQNYRNIQPTTAAQERARLEFRTRREQARLARDTRRALAAIEALERAAPPEGQRRRKAPHTPPSASPKSRRAA